MTVATLGVAEVERFLAERYADVDGVIVLAGSEWSRAFAFTSAGRALVVRFGHHAQDHAKDRFLADDLLTSGDTEGRLRTYQLHIALDHQQYCAWTGNEAGLTWNTDQVRVMLTT